MWKKCAFLVLLPVGLAACSRGGFTPIEASGMLPDAAPAMVTSTGDDATDPRRASYSSVRTQCPERGERRPTTLTRYWPYSYRIGEVTATRDQVVLDWLDYDAAGEAQWYSYRYRPQPHPWESQAWTEWIDVADSRAVMSGLESGAAYGVQVRAAVDHPVPGGRPDCFFTRPADRVVRTAPLHATE